MLSPFFILYLVVNFSGRIILYPLKLLKSLLSISLGLLIVLSPSKSAANISKFSKYPFSQYNPVLFIIPTLLLILSRFFTTSSLINLNCSFSFFVAFTLTVAVPEYPFSIFL